MPCIEPEIAALNRTQALDGRPVEIAHDQFEIGSALTVQPHLWLMACRSQLIRFALNLYAQQISDASIAKLSDFEVPVARPSRYPVIHVAYRIW